MTEFEFLKKMYRRLHEFERFLAQEKSDNPKRKDLVNESAVCAIEGAIKDYLAMRKEGRP